MPKAFLLGECADIRLFFDVTGNEILSSYGIVFGKETHTKNRQKQKEGMGL
jgi:hypothetical protein